MKGLHLQKGEPSARERVQKAAIELFAENGYAGTSVREIVAGAGVTKPVLYYYFGSKEGLFQSILEDAANLHRGIVEEVLQGSGDALDRFIRLFDRVYQDVHEHWDIFRMVHSLIYSPPQGAPGTYLREFVLRTVEKIKDVYLQGLARNEVAEADPDTAAFLLTTLLYSSIGFRFANPELSDPERPIKMLRLVFKGLEPPKKTVSGEPA
ncbi:MAG: TetR/AcrR family transcriptional regulator [Thermodesulfobacteriota bacterium]|nr:TetR/AcrR family transcriptional regulator [Thermodesulfobacteriota bacterium]